MLNLLFPERADNGYQGHKLAIWLFALLMLMRAAISLGSIFNGHEAAGSADGIPLGTYTPAGAQAVVALFAMLGLARLIGCLLGLLVLLRYRALIPVMFTLLLAEQLGRALINQLLPIARTGSPPGSAINLMLLALMIIGLVLTLRRRAPPAVLG